MHDLKHDSDALRSQIAAQEAQIAAEGGSYAGRRADLLAARTRLDASAGHCAGRRLKMAGGLLPFAFAPQMLHAVREPAGGGTRGYHEQEAARQLLARQEALLQRMAGDAALWADGAAQVAPPLRERILAGIAGQPAQRHARPGNPRRRGHPARLRQGAHPVAPLDRAGAE